MKRIKDGSFNKLVSVDDHRYKNHPAVTESLDDLFERTYPTMVDLIAKREGPGQGDKNKGGIARANTDSEKVVVESNQEVQVTQTSVKGAKLDKSKPAKSAVPPGTPNTSLIGTVPGVAFGVTESTTPKPKTLSELRKQRS